MFFLWCEIVLRTSIRTFEAENDWKKKRTFQSQPKFRCSNKEKRVRDKMLKMAKTIKLYSLNHKIS